MYDAWRYCLHGRATEPSPWTASGNFPSPLHCLVPQSETPNLQIRYLAGDSASGFSTFWASSHMHLDLASSAWPSVSDRYLRGNILRQVEMYACCAVPALGRVCGGPGQTVRCDGRLRCHCRCRTSWMRTPLSCFLRPAGLCGRYSILVAISLCTVWVTTERNGPSRRSRCNIYLWNFSFPCLRYPQRLRSI
jgi:hypothetical protein